MSVLMDAKTKKFLKGEEEKETPKGSLHMEVACMCMYD